MAHRVSTNAASRDSGQLTEADDSHERDSLRDRPKLQASAISTSFPLRMILRRLLYLDSRRMGRRPLLLFLRLDLVENLPQLLGRRGHDCLSAPPIWSRITLNDREARRYSIGG
jgi:hypothetical protein